MVGDERHGARTGPARLTDAALAAFAGTSVEARVEAVERGTAFRDSVSASAAINRRVAAAVRTAVEADELPLVLAGSCDVSMGVLGGFEHASCGVVWLDAHGDFNTPESTTSGFFGGMSLAVITGHCYRSLWAQVGDSAPIAEAATVLVGVRDLSPEEERDRLARSAIHVVGWAGGRPQADAHTTLDGLAERADDVYVHVDLDALDPEIAPGIVDPPVPGGLSIADLEDVLGSVRDRFRIRAAAVTTYNPEVDEGDRTLRAGLACIELLTG
jgi:arginase